MTTVMPAPTAPPHSSFQALWWTTSGGSSFLTSKASGGSTVTFVTSAGSTLPVNSLTSISGGSVSSNYNGNSGSSTASSSSATSASLSSVTSTSTSSRPGSTSTGQINAQNGPVCLGDGVDATAGGLLSVLIIPSVIGVLIWLLFAFLRPRYRQVYAAREWFVAPGLRPRPLKNTLWAFLNPNVPLVPPVPADVSSAGKSSATDASLFPSDEQLSQRTLWTSLLVVLGWSFLALVGALPLYLIRTDCLSSITPHPAYQGAYSTLQDLSVLRLLQQLDNERGEDAVALLARPSGQLHTFARRTSSGPLTNTRIRLIVLAALVVVLAVIPALWKLLHEYTRLAAYRQRWINVRCEGKELGWLSARRAPGFAGWGEKRIKDFLVKGGLSSTLDQNGGRNGNGSRRRREATDLNEAEEEKLDVDIQSLFSIVDTTRLVLLIEERDEILENLEIAEARYIDSFRLATPDPSIAEFQPETIENDPNRPHISRPRALTGVHSRRRRGRARNPAIGSSSIAPSSYMLPSQYYKLRRIEGVSSPMASSTGELVPDDSFSNTVHSRVVGSRFQEVQNRSSVVWGRLPLGSKVKVDKEGLLGPIPHVADDPIPDPTRFGPNHIEGHDASESAGHQRDVSDDWVDVPQNPEQSVYMTPDSTPRPTRYEPGTPSAPDTARTAVNTPPATAEDQRQPLIWNYPASHRSTFPMRQPRYSELAPSEVPAPHTRLQPRGPFFRPMSGLNHEDLGQIYGDVSQWRSELKSINQRIAEAQNDAYVDIADGVRIKGWLMVGRGIRFIPGIKMIEGRAKEDVRWHELQDEGTARNKMIIIAVTCVVCILLACGLVAVAGLALGTAPNFTHYIGFLRPLAERNDWISGLATGLAAAVGATVFITIAVVILHATTRLSTAVSVSALELRSFKLVFWVITSVGFVFLTVVGALLFSLHAFNTKERQTSAVANGSVYMTALLLSIVINVAIIAPGLLLLQPVRLWRILRAEKSAATPRLRFRAIYPGSYNPTFAMSCCILAVIFASTFALLFPLIGPAVVILIGLTLIAHRFLVGYVYARTHSQTGGLLQMWLLRRFAFLVSLQPLALGLILLSRRLWEEGGVLCGTALLVMAFVELYCWRKLRQPGRKMLSAITQNSLSRFGKVAKPSKKDDLDDSSTDLFSENTAQHRTRGSFASVLEMMSVTLAVMPSGHQNGVVPLPTETLNDLTATERAARTHPEAPPHLPPLPFVDHADEMAGILYPPELIAPTPIIWLPNDHSGVARGEAYDLQRYHDLHATLDVRAKEDVVALGVQERNRLGSDSRSNPLVSSPTMARRAGPRQDIS